jgi:hypothetical protein
VGKSNVPIQGLKRTKSKGSAVKGENFFLLWIHRTYEFIYFENYEIIPVTWHTETYLLQHSSNIWLGTDADYGFERYSKKVDTGE